MLTASPSLPPPQRLRPPLSFRTSLRWVLLFNAPSPPPSHPLTPSLTRVFCACVEARCKYVPSCFVQFCTTPDHMTANLCRCRRCDVRTAVLFVHIAWGLVRETLRVQQLCFCMLLPLSWHVETSRLGCGAQQHLSSRARHQQAWRHTLMASTSHTQVVFSILGRACCSPVMAYCFKPNCVSCSSSHRNSAAHACLLLCIKLRCCHDCNDADQVWHAGRCAGVRKGGRGSAEGANGPGG